ncbi:MAG: hypothetical protein HRU20_05250 [Pseudomonadales bacterium]|nr:hypothetical protein [Pseudomonadales bacterium]
MLQKLMSLFAILITCIFLPACEKAPANNTGPAFHLISNDNFEEGPFAYIDKADFIDSQGQVTAHSQLLARCSVLDEHSDTPCDTQTLPFLASENLNPNTQQILNRLIVSDLWMADNFALLLQDMPADMYRLFASTTAIVIHREIRPAFFWSETGAIYLDPAYLWLTQTQKNSISQDADYRADFASQLKFINLARYSIDGDFAFGSNANRNTQQTLYALSALLFHELAHANDFFPPASVSTAASKHPAEQLIIAHTASSLSNSSLPLQSDIWHRLANVIWRGIDASADLSSLTASDVGQLFAVDGANDAYNFLETPYPEGLHFEDTAMLFEEVMMKIHYDIDREIAFATALNDTIALCSDLRVHWQAINRYREDHVLIRAQLIIDVLLPGHNYDGFFIHPPAAGIYTYCVAQTTQSRQSLSTPSSIPLQSHFWH